MVIDKNAADTFVAGERPPPRRSNRGSRFYLAEYPIPKHIRELVGDEKVPDCITEGVTRGNYGIYFTTLINLEEVQVEVTFYCQGNIHPKAAFGSLESFPTFG